MATKDCDDCDKCLAQGTTCAGICKRCGGIAMLTKANAEGWSPAPGYPTYRYATPDGGKCLIEIGGKGQRMEPMPRGYVEELEHQDEDDHFLDYIERLQAQHKDLSDDALRVAEARAIGRKKAAGLRDELRRRGVKTWSDENEQLSPNSP